MKHDDETLSTRDIAGGAPTAERVGGDESRFDREPDRDVVDPPPTASSRPDGEGPASRSDEDEPGSLLPDDQQQGFVVRWEEIQTEFVDDPRRAVESADALVATVMQHLADGFAGERERLEGMWGRGEDVGTEDLRIALQRYRTFFRRLLSA
jgi:hypothetical protein